MTDVIIPLKWHSHNNFVELRYALRSLEKYMSNVGYVFIIGATLPKWANKELILIKKNDASHYAAINIKDKVMLACRMQSLSDNIIMMNDDHFLLRPFDADHLPYLYHNSLLYKFLDNQKNYYGQQILNTIEALKPDHTTLHYDVHFPIRFNKKVFLELDKFNWSVEQGLLVKSMYCNVNRVKGIFSPDLNIMSPPRSLDALNDMLQDRWYFSTHDGAIWRLMVDKLQELYPEKSRFEN